MRGLCLFWDTLFITSGQDQSLRYLGLMVRPNLCFQLWLSFLHPLSLLPTSTPQFMPLHTWNSCHKPHPCHRHCPNPTGIYARPYGCTSTPATFSLFLTTCGTISSPLLHWEPLGMAPFESSQGPPNARPPIAGLPKSQVRAYAQETLAWVREQAAFIPEQVNSSVRAEGWIITAWL